MALRNTSSTTTTTTTTTTAEAEKPVTGTPAFEGMDDTTVSDTASEVVDGPAPTTTAAPTAPTTTAVAITKEQVLQVRPVLDKNTQLRGLRDAIPPEELEGMGIGVFPRVTPSLGGFVVNKGERKLGKAIRVEVLSWNYIWMVTTGEQDNPEANKLIRSSRDGKNLSPQGVQIGDGSIAAYLQHLKSQGYDKAAQKQYIEVYANLLAYEETKDRQITRIEVPADEQKIYQISLSPQSVGQWGKYLLEGALRKARGHADDSLVTLIQAERTVNSKQFALAEFEPKW